MPISFEEISTIGKRADSFESQNGKLTRASPGITTEATAARAHELLKKRSRFLHSEVDRIEDFHWVSETLYAKGYVLSEEHEARRFYCTADKKFEDTSLGGNYVCNARPGYTPYADPPKPGLVSGRNSFSVASHMTNQGMGHYYSEALDDSYQVVHMRFGKPEFNSMTGFFSSFYDAGAAYLANSGRMTGFAYTLGKGAGFAGLYVLLGGLMFFSLLAVAYVGAGIKGMLSTSPSKFYYSRPTMAVYWLAVTNIVNQIATYKGMFPSFTGDQKIGETIEYDAEMHSDLQNLMPNVFGKSGYIDVKSIVNRTERINLRVRKAQKQAMEQATSYAELQQKLKDAHQQVNGGKNGLSLEELLLKWRATELGNTDKKTDKASAETLATGTLDQRFTANQLDGPQNASKREDYAAQSFFKNPLDYLNSKLGLFSEYLDAEFSDGSAFATFRVDHTGSVNESFSNSSRPSDVGQKFNSVSAQGRAAYYSFAGGNVAPGLGEILGSVKQFAAGALDSIGLSGVLSLAGSAFVDIPDNWENSTATLPSKSYTMRLVSPYGHPVAQLTNIFIPLAMILAATLPHAAGRQAYTMPFLCELYDQGRCITRTGMVESLMITRGTSNLGFTKNKDMLAVDVQFTVKDFSSIMYMPLDTGSMDPFKTINNHDSAYSDYLSVLGGAALGDQIYTGKKLKLRLKNWLRGNIQSMTSVDHWAAVIRELPIINLYDLRYEDTGRGN